jgi:hypothetical protein
MRDICRGDKRPICITIMNEYIAGAEGGVAGRMERQGRSAVGTDIKGRRRDRSGDKTTTRGACL